MGDQVHVITVQRRLLPYLRGPQMRATGLEMKGMEWKPLHICGLVSIAQVLSEMLYKSWYNSPGLRDLLPTESS